MAELTAMEIRVHFTGGHEHGLAGFQGDVVHEKHEEKADVVGVLCGELNNAVCEVGGE